MGWISRLRRTFGKERLAQDHEDELEFHRSMREQWNLEHGLAREEAHRDASVRFGSKVAWRERMSEIDRKSTRLNSSHERRSRMPSSA